MLACRKDQDWTEVMACQEKSDENEKTVIELVHLGCIWLTLFRHILD